MNKLLGLLCLVILGLQFSACDVPQETATPVDDHDDMGETGGMSGSMPPTMSQPMLTECQKSHEFRRLIDHTEQFIDLMIDRSLSGMLTEGEYNSAFKSYQALELNRIGSAGLSTELQHYCDDHQSTCTLAMALHYAADYINGKKEGWFKKTEKNVCQPGSRIVQNMDGTIGYVIDPCATRKDVVTYLPGYVESAKLAQDIDLLADSFPPVNYNVIDFRAVLNPSLTAEGKVQLKAYYHDLTERVRANGITAYGDLNCAMDEAFAP